MTRFWQQVALLLYGRGSDGHGTNQQNPMYVYLVLGRSVEETGPVHLQQVSSSLHPSLYVYQLKYQLNSTHEPHVHQV